MRGLLDHLDDLFTFFVGTALPGEGNHVVHYFSRVGGVVDQRLRPDGDFVAEDGGHFVRMTGAADIAEQGDPVDGSRISLSKPDASEIQLASRQERNCDSSGWPKALSCARARVATNSPKRSGLAKIGNSPDAGPGGVGVLLVSIDHLLRAVVKQKVQKLRPAQQIPEKEKRHVTRNDQG